MSYPAPGNYQIVHGRYRAEIASHGAGLRVLEVDGFPLVETWPVGEKPPLSAGLVLAPWPNRVGDGRFEFDHVEHQLEITEPSRGNASHGFVRHVDWKLVSHTETSVKQTVNIMIHRGWPYPLTLTVTHELAADGLTVTHTANNIGTTVAPFGLGVHTFVRAGDAPLNACTLTLAAGTWLPLDAVRRLPAGTSVAATGSDYDFSRGRRMAGVWLDTPFSALTPDLDGKSRHRLVGPDGTGVQLWMDEKFRWVQVFTADPSRDQAYPGRGRALAIEPMTCPPDALRSGIDLIHLEPRATWRASWGLQSVGLPSIWSAER